MITCDDGSDADADADVNCASSALTSVCFSLCVRMSNLNERAPLPTTIASFRWKCRFYRPL